MEKDIKDKKPVEYILKEEEHQWPKGEVLTFTYDAFREVDMRFDGCVDEGETLEFRMGDFGLLAKLWQKITKGEPGEPQLVKLGEFYSLGSIKATGEKFGFTPLELMAKNDEKDYIVKVKFTLPEKKEEA